jgi:hypothetical protein
MFSYLPSVLSTWQLPGLAAGALSSALQRRVLLYLLKRTLGHLIKDKDLKLDQIDVASVGGKLEVRGVHLDAEVRKLREGHDGGSSNAYSLLRSSGCQPIPTTWCLKTGIWLGWQHHHPAPLAEHDR